MAGASQSTLLFSIITFTYLFASLCYICMLIFKKDILGKVGTGVTLVTLLVHTAAIIMRWVESYNIGYGHAPFSNLYESLVFFAWTIALIYLVVEFAYKNRSVGAFVMPMAFLAMAYAGIKPSDIQPLLPALKSNWLIAHVISAFLGYAAFAVSAGLSVMFLIPKKGILKGLASILPESDILDVLIYRNIAFGFILLTAGIITGAIWANSAWGTYWSWDPKETWSLITWFVYAAVLHARMVRGWAGKRMAILSLIGFICVLFTYFGVNLLKGLHSYAAWVNMV